MENVFYLHERTIVLRFGLAHETEHQVESALLLDVVIRKGAAILQLLAGKDEALLVGWDALLVLDLGLDSIDTVGALHIKSDVLASQSLHENLHCCCR